MQYDDTSDEMIIPEAKIEPPEWLTNLATRMINEVNRKYVGSAARHKRGLSIVELNGLPVVFNDTSGWTGVYGISHTLKLLDRETDNPITMQLIINLKDSNAYLSNGYSRVGFTYPLTFGSATGDYAE